VRVEPLAVTDGDAPLVAVAVSERPLERALADFYRSLLMIAVAATAAALLVAALLARRLAAPVEHTARAAGRVAAGDLDTRIAPAGSTETRALAESFNHMTRELAADRQRLIQAERLAAWRDVARRLAHEIGNALSPIQLSIDSLRRTRSSSPERLPQVLEQSVPIVGEEVERLRRLVREFSAFARSPALRPRTADVDALVAEVTTLARAGCPRIELDAGTPAGTAEIDADAVRGALSNLLKNATEAAGDGGRVVVRTGGDRDTFTVEVTDDGPGVPPEEQERIFLPYVTHRDGGTGLGLAIVMRTASEHGGRVELESEPGRGATFRLVLPRVAAGAPAVAGDTPPA
jgi:nitrogen fixation/metabolism regulation signal transduction histidine kinase